MDIRKINPADYLSIYFLQNESHPTHLRESMVVLTSKVFVSPESCFCVCSEDECYGYIIALPYPLNQTPSLRFPVTKYNELDTLLIHDCVVKRYKRGQGIAHELFLKVKAYAAEQKFKQIALIAVEGTYSYWERFGFEITSTSVDPAYGEDAVYMVHEL